MALRQTIASALVLFIAAGIASAQLTRSKPAADEFGSIECKILLYIEGVKGSDSINTIVAKTAKALEGLCDVERDTGHKQVAYLDTEDQKLRKAGYVLRVRTYPPKPDKLKVTLKGRWENLADAEKLTGGGLAPSKLEIDVSGERQINSISYKLKLKMSDFDKRMVTAKGTMKAIGERYPELGNYLESIVGDDEMELPGYADHYSGSAMVKAGVLPSMPDSPLKLDLDIFKLGQKTVIIELSFSDSASHRERALQTYRELTSALKERKVAAYEQATKTASYLKHFSDEKKAAPAATTGATKWKK